MKHMAAYHLARGLMDKHGLKDWSFGFDNATRRLGCCFHRKQRIQMSKTFVALNDLDKITQVMLHEIAHALCEPREQHGPRWKAKALEIGCVEAKSTTSAVSAPPKYIGTCPGNHAHFRRRATKYRMSCTECSPRFSVEHLIKWSINPEYKKAMEG